MEKQSGFTLVELLIVLAIIGILTSVILGSLNDARTSGIDTKIIAEMDAIQKRASIEESSTYTYDGTCGSNGITQSDVIIGLITSINTLASSTVVCNSATAEYAVSAGLESVFWCVDSTGAHKEIPTALTTELVCP